MRKKVIFEPGNHQDLVMLFCLIQEQLNMLWLGSCLDRKKGQRRSSPDGEVLDYSNGHGKIKTVEFEFLSSQYNHTEKYDYLVCWSEDRDVPEVGEIIELKGFFPGIASKETLRELDDTQKVELIEGLAKEEEWTKSELQSLSPEQQKILVYLLRKKEAIGTDQIAEKMDLSSREVGGAISGFTQKQTPEPNKGHYEEIVEKDSRKGNVSSYRFVPRMRDKYSGLIEEVLGHKYDDLC